MPVFTVMLGAYLLGFLAVTARRSVATTRVLTAAAACGGGAAALWAAVVFAFRPIPASAGAALVLTAVAAVVASASAGRRGLGEQRVLAALCAATFAALLIVLLVMGLSSYGPPSLIPDLAPAALTPVDDLAQSRDEVVEVVSIAGRPCRPKPDP